MLPLTYYFRNSFMKSGYVRGKLEKQGYERAKQEGEDTNTFVKNLVENVLEEQKKTTKEAITSLEIEINNSDKELKNIKESKVEHEENIKKEYLEKNKILEEEKSRVEQELVNSTLLDAQQLKNGKELLGNLLNNLASYAEQVKKLTKDQSERLITQWKGALKHNTKLTIQEIKENLKLIEGNEQATEKAKKGTKVEGQKSMGKSLGYLIFLGCMCIFDIFLGYGVAIAIFDMYEGEMIFKQEYAAFFVALFVIPLAIGIIHFSALGIGGGKNHKITKFLGEASVVLTILIVGLYVIQSAPQLLVKRFGSDFGLALAKQPEFLFRAFLIPSLFAGEVIIDLIDWDGLYNYFGIGKKGSRNILSKLITKGLLFLKKHKITDFAKEESKELTRILLDMEKEEVPAFSESRKNINEIQSVLNPIFDTQSKKIDKYNEKIANIKNKMELNLNDYQKRLNEINEKYAPQINKIENIKHVNEAKINKLNHDLNQASIDVKQGILYGLID